MDRRELPIFTPSQLALRNGQDKEQVWVACDGLIYDVTHSKMWNTGLHYGNWAGQDLTHEIEKDAPHSKNVLKNFQNFFKKIKKFFSNF